MIDVQNALSLAFGKILPVCKSEKITLQRALGRILSEDVTARKSLPCFDNSALDGYAYCSKS